jgi:hypothetical protein
VACLGLRDELGLVLCDVCDQLAALAVEARTEVRRLHRIGCGEGGRVDST